MNTELELELVLINHSLTRRANLAAAQKAALAFPKKEDEALRVRYEKTLMRAKA